MSNTVHKLTPHQFEPDPASLEGLDDFLEGLIDKIFQPESPVPESPVNGSSETPVQLKPAPEVLDFSVPEKNTPRSELSGEVDRKIVELFADARDEVSSLSHRPSLFERDDHGLQMEAVELQVKLLSAQLEYRNHSLKAAYERIKSLENIILEKDDQLAELPELLKRSFDAGEYEIQLKDLRDELKRLSMELSSAQERIDLVRAHWLGKISVWLLER